MYFTLVTKLKKEKGKLVYDYDTYIGPQISNKNWELPQSIFHNPYHFGRVGTVHMRLDMYARRILGNGCRKMPAKVSSLHGKMLACMCPNILNWHGHVLTKQAHELSGGNCWTNIYLFHPEDKSKSIDGGHIVFFKGEKCVLSNCYFTDKHPLIISYGEGDLRHNVTFRLGV